MTQATLPSPQEAAELCKDRDYVLIVDDSISMSTPDCPGNTPRFGFSKEIVGLVAGKAEEYDEDGNIELTMFGSTITPLGEMTAGEVSAKFPPAPTGMSTQLGAALDREFNHYFNSGNNKAITFIVLTDGEASDKPLVEEAIKNAAKAGGDGERVAIAFWQIGNDPGASQFLDYLDNDLGEIDIVDTRRMSEVVENIAHLEVLMAAAIID